MSGPIWWSPDGKTLTFTVGDDRVEYVGRTTTAGGAVEKLTTGRRTVANVSLGADGSLTLLAGTATETPEVHALEAGKLRKLTKVERRPAVASCSSPRPRTSRRRARTARW